MLRSLMTALYSKAWLLLTLTALFWAGNFVIGRGVHELVPPIALAWCRWALATAIVMPFALPHVRRDWPEIRRGLPELLFLGTIGVASFNTLSYLGLNHTTALNALVLQSSGPVLIALTCFMLFRDPLGPRQILGIAISLTGVLSVILNSHPEALTELRFNRGDLLVFLALVFWGFYTACLRYRPKIHWLSFIATTFAIGTLVITPLFIWEQTAYRQISFDPPTLASILYVAIFPSILAYIFFNRGVELVGGATAGIFLHMVPVFGSGMAIVFLGEQVQLYHVIGFTLVILGVTLATRGARRIGMRSAGMRRD
ncbi:MAG: DMT family transporter [Hyphomicrobiales bacterium]